MTRIKRLIMMAAVLTSGVTSSHAQEWSRYDFDAVVSFESMEAPSQKDTAGQSMRIAATEAGKLIISRFLIESDSPPANEEQLKSFYQSFLNGYSKSNEILSQRYDSVGVLVGLRYTTKLKAGGVPGECLVVLVENNVYAFQYYYNVDLDDIASVESERFFKSIKFRSSITPANQMADQDSGYSAGYALGRWIGLFLVIFIVVSFVGGTIAVIYVIAKKKQSRSTGV
jgi:hypothetical protein